MLKKIIIGFGLSQLLLAETTHSFYFNNKYEVIKENITTEERAEKNEILKPTDKDIKSELKVKITILEEKKNKPQETQKTTKKTQGLWNPLKGFFKYQNEIENKECLPVEKTAENHDMENGKYYVLNILTEESSITDYNFFQIKNEKNIDSYTKNKNNIIIKGDILSGKFYIFNKKAFIDFQDKFVIKFHNKKLELEYVEYESGLFN